MEERRKYKRLPIKIDLSINELFRQDNEIIEDLSVKAYVINISKTGLGLESKAVIPINYYFDARIDLKEKDFFYCVLKVVRIEANEGNYLYGCEFIGLAEFLADKIDVYEKELGTE